MTSMLPALAALVVKEHVGLGGLPEASRAPVLALVWAGLPTVAMAEPQVNQALKAQLASTAAFLSTDHVELRRWLVDTGWLQRDGFGRQYLRVASAELAAGQGALAQQLQGMDVAAWVAATRQTHQEKRQARRQAWQAAQPPAQGS